MMMTESVKSYPIIISYSCTATQVIQLVFVVLVGYT